MRRATRPILQLSLLLFIGTLISCDNNQSKKLSPPATATVNHDSINAVLKSINAKEKEKKLSRLFKRKAKRKRFNGCVLVAQKGQIIYKDALGYSNFKTKEELTINSAFQLSSTSKPFTAVAILLLSEQGKLKLTDSVQKHIPDFPYANITIETLLTHRSGLSNYLYFGEDYCDKENCYNGNLFDNNSVLEIMKNNKPRAYSRPNRRFEYCNTNYALLASIVEKASGETFSVFMKENIFDRLGMKNTWVYTPSTQAIHKNSTLGHTTRGRVERNKYADCVVGDKGIYSTVEDLFLFDQAMYSDKLLKQETIQQSYIGYSNEKRGIRNYGYGWRLTEEKGGGKIVYHNGWWHGYNSLFFRRLSDQTTVIILSNRDNKSIYKIEDILAIVNANKR